MEVQFLNKFSKDLDKIKQPKDKTALLNLIKDVKAAESLRDIPSIKKLAGFQDAYRIRVGQLRVGIFISEEKSIIQFARVAFRKDIYNILP
ncbi:type II toxin-antitoxin system RelE family toxin [Reichenbachiella ulvae]|uniref:mRNA interferase RelE/StbE n=1 Tax=Reichenbachiella ulvae TaxID=2980104 RepID=A0ABT3CTK5_9BACT|nr:hypothetical protein [Reichenbachiella ulvae]MCV9387035.1 hypothetical protein [Reichenbachiella ulvae]